MAAAGVDRLSELPDDLLRRVLHFAPLREAASTTALSRRWRAPLWRSSGAVNLETGNVRNSYDNPRFFTQRDCFVTASEAALDAADVPVRRLTLRLDSDLNERAGDMHTWYRDRAHDKIVSRYTGLVDVALYHGAARRGVEELRIVASGKSDYLYVYDYNRDHTGLFTVTLDYLQLETIRVLELTHCKGLLYQRQGTHLALPRLSSLRLSHCPQHLRSLQQVIDAAPALAAIHLETVLIDATDKEAKHGTTRHLRCPAATVLVLDSCKWEEESQGRNRSVYNYETTAVAVQDVEIHAPRLRRFRYKGQLRSFSFSAQPLELEEVDLDFSGRGNNGKNNDPDRDLAAFWRFARSFTSTKEFRLRVNHLEDIAVLSEARRTELLPAFRRLERLEVQGVDSTKGKPAAMAILNMLRCCPMLAALRINLTLEKKADSSNKKGVPDTRTPQKEIQIAALAQCHLFQCLQSSLRRVGLQFQLEKSNCLGVKLIKFFAENAIVLEEMYIAGGDDNLCKHMNPKTEKWNSKRRKSGATSFVVLPLKR